METKLKICSKCGNPSKLWKSTPKLCKKCAALNRPVQAIKRSAPINKVSDKQKKINAAYSVLCSQFKKDHPICQARIKCSGSLTTEVHHKRGRGKAYMLDSTTYLACCSDCHRWIEENPSQAKALGFSESRLSIN